MGIDLSRYKVVYGEKVLKALALLHYEFAENESQNETFHKLKLIDVLVINEDGNLETIYDEAWRFQFIPILNG